MASKTVRWSERVAGGEGGLKPEQLVGVEFRLLKWTETTAYDKPAFSVLLDWNGEQHVMQVSQQVLVNQLRELAATAQPGEEILTTIQYIKGAKFSYYMFSDPDVEADGGEPAF